MIKRTELEKKYWNEFALDPKVDLKYISDIEKAPFLELLNDMHGTVLDIGCGVGRLMKKGYYGVDTSINMLEIAKQRKLGCMFFLNNGRDLPFADAYFDCAYSVLLFQHLPLDAVNNYIKETARVLKKDGLFTFQFIAGKEESRFGELSFEHKISDIADTLTDNNFLMLEREVGKVHPLWTWIKAKKI